MTDAGCDLGGLMRWRRSDVMKPAGIQCTIAAGCSAAVGFAGCCGLADCRAKEWAAVMRSRWLWPVTGLSAWWYTSGHVGGSGHGLRLRR